MKLLLLTGDAERPAAEAGLVVHWDRTDVPVGDISMPLAVHADLLRIRAEHAAWAYNMGFFKIGGHELADKLRCGATLSMWWTSLLYERHPRMTPGLYNIYKLRCLELLCLRNGVDAIVLEGGDAVLGKTLENYCAAAGVAFAWHENARNSEAPRPLVPRIYHAMPAPLRALFRFGHWLFTVRRKLPYKKETGKSCKNPALIVTYFPNIDLEAASRGRFRSRYWESLHDVLNEEARREGGHFVRWLFIRFPQPGLSLDQCISLRDSFRKKGEDGASFDYLEEYLAHGDLWRGLGRWFWLCVTSLGAEKKVRQAFCLAGSKMNFWLYAKKDWAESFRGWRCLERALQYLAFARHARKTGAMRFNLFPLENCPWERMLTVAARTVPANGPVIGAQHSSIRPTDFRYFDDRATFSTPECAAFQPDYFCGNGESACRQWLDFGMPEQRLREVEALRYLYLADRKKEAANPINAIPQEPGEPLADGPEKKLLVLASFFRGETENLCRVLATAINSGLLDDWAITVKPHPYLPVVDRLTDLLGPKINKIRFADGPLALELKPGVTVLAANSTTAALEAAILDLPLMVMQATDDFDLCPIQDAPGLVRITGIDDFKKELPGLEAVELPENYLDLDPRLPAWRKLLNLK